MLRRELLLACLAAGCGAALKMPRDYEAIPNPDGTLTLRTRYRRYRCDRGHEWRTSPTGASYPKGHFAIRVGEESFCAACICDLLRGWRATVTDLGDEVG